MSLRRCFESLLCATALLAGGLGCQAKIGDDCSTGTDCSLTGGRTCDTSMPGGYCTVPNCEPDTCAEEAACIAFMLAPATSTECRGIGEMRGVRTFCMRRCSSQQDCRIGYECLDLNADGNAWGAQRIDHHGDGRVCALAYGAMPAPEGASSTSYCTASTRTSANDGYYNTAGATSWSSASAGSAGTAGSAGVAGQAAGSSSTEPGAAGNGSGG